MHSRLFLDTVFIQALLNRRDFYHSKAKAFFPKVREAVEIWTTEAVLIEVGNALSMFNRQGATKFIRQCYVTPNMNVVPIDSVLLNQAIGLYEARPDKEWGLTDCISFVVMKEQNLVEAVTADKHFVQAGFLALLL